MKKCFKCGKRKPIEQFYKHSQMDDGHLGKCIECAKQDAKTRYHDPKNREKIQAYERSRFNTPHRKKKYLEYQRTRRAKWPEKTKARELVRKALLSGQLVKEPCRICGDVNVQAHHTDYSKPLDVQWLCFTHHRDADMQMMGLQRAA
jgi:hypothetical protein